MSTQYSTGTVSAVTRRRISLYFDLTLADGSVLSFFRRVDVGWLKDGETVTVRWDTDTPLQAGRHEALEVFREGWPTLPTGI